jgi:hypothetical protein
LAIATCDNPSHRPGAAPIQHVLRLEPPTAAMWGVIMTMSVLPLALATIGRWLRFVASRTHGSA